MDVMILHESIPGPFEIGKSEARDTVLKARRQQWPSPNARVRFDALHSAEGTQPKVGRPPVSPTESILFQNHLQSASPMQGSRKNHVECTPELRGDHGPRP